MRTGVALLTYGSPRSLDDVPAYLTRIRGGREPDAALAAEFRRRYARIGGSPLVEITTRQAAALEHALDDGSPVAAGMRFSAPSVAEAVTELVARGAERVLGVVLSPQFSPLIMGGYGRALDEAGQAAGVPTRLAAAWHREPRFVEALARRIQQALVAFPPDARDRAPVLLTAHSLPRRVVDAEPEFVAQLEETAALVARAAGLPPHRWRFVYQSAGHSPEPWLTPDLLDVLPDLAREGHRYALVAPVQFLADHLETLYDVDVAAVEQAHAAGVEHLVRAPALNDAPDFAAALAAVVRREAAAWDAASPAPTPVGKGAWATA